MERNDLFLAGVVEGFYGQPWSPSQRLELFEWMAQWGLNTYFYAPKNDVKHRAVWRETYNNAELASLGELIQRCKEHSITFFYGLSPGLDIRFADPSEVDAIKRRFHQLMEVGARHFALLFDDLPGEIDLEDRRVHDSVAAAQSTVTNSIYHWLCDRFSDSRLLFCPTPYCDRMDRSGLGGRDYLDTIGRELAPEIDILWTGPEIISETIPVESIQALSQRLQRSPVIWDNLHANDYDLRRLYCGPYSGRSADLLQHIRGILSNPNNEFPINFIPLKTLGQFIRDKDTYNPREAYLAAVSEWTTHYQTVKSPISLEDLILLADCYYLPHEEGVEAARLQSIIGKLIDQPSTRWGDDYDKFLWACQQVARIFEGLTQLKDRELFYSWSRRVWELNEELDLIQKFLAHKQLGTVDADGFSSESHLPQTYRGGMVARLQRRLEMDAQGRFQPAGN